MASVKRKTSKKNRQFLPETAQVFLARRIIDGVAVCLFAAGLFLLMALLSYHPTDPSWNASGTDLLVVSNWAGYSGAWTADIFLQVIGWSGYVFPIILMLWGFRVWKRWSLTPVSGRIAALLASAIFGTLMLSRVPSYEMIPPTTLGGSAGTLSMNVLTGFIQSIGIDYGFQIILACASILFCLTFTYATSISGKTLQRSMKLLLRVALTGVYKCLSAFLSFFDWVRHHGTAEEPDTDRWAFSLPDWLATKPDPAREITSFPLRASPSPRQVPPVIEQQPQSGARAIPVVTPRQNKAVNDMDAGQGRFVLSDNGGEWHYPPLSMLQEVPEETARNTPDQAALQKNADLLQTVFEDFNISGDIVSIHPGPVVTLYELEPAPGTKSQRVISLSDDIARSMSAVSVRAAVVPGRNVIGIELPNQHRQIVYMREILQTDQYVRTKAKLPLILGKDIGGQPIIADLAKMPHLLVAGTTGSGKSVAVNTMLLSLLFTLPPEKCRFLMIDPKMLELSVYNDIPHLLSPVVTEPGKAVVSLKWAVHEMEERYRAMSKLGVRNIEGYNARLAEARKKGEVLMRRVQTGFDPETGKPVYEEQPLDLTELPYIVIVVDEFADLMLVAGKDVESAVQRLAQMARAAGMHIIMATQRPSVDVITGVIKANFPTRISFQVTSKIDSRTILGEGGAEQLLGMGDMLYMAPGGRITRVHGPFVSDQDVESTVNFLKSQAEPAYIDEIATGPDLSDSEVLDAMFGDGEMGGEQVDELYDQAVALVAREGKASTSFVQRYLQIGYNRAARIIEEMERQGVISKATPTGKREVLIHDHSGE